MSLTLATNKKPSMLIGKMCSLLLLSHRVHKDECFLFKGFFLDHLPPNIRTYLMREDISNPRKLAAKADKIWQSSSAKSVNAVSATSPAPPGCDDSKFFPKLNLQKGYIQIPMRPADVPKTAIITPFGLFKFLHLPFGL